MKKLLSSLCGLLLFGAVTAQNQTTPIAKPGHMPADIKIDATVDKPISDQVKGAAFFTEDFANGFDGNNGIGPWVAEDSGGDEAIWMMATAQSPAGEFSTTALALQSTTVANGWAIFDADLWNTPINEGVSDVQGFLMSPSIDCAERNTVLVSWEQCFRYCCFSPAPISLGVSNDGGATWTEFEAHGDFIESANTFSGNNLPTTVDISCAAANQSDVMIRFGYNPDFASGYSHYFWGVDDIAIFENTAQNDLKVNQVVNGDVFSEWEYRINAIQQATSAANGGLLVGTMYENVGGADQTGVTITVEILDDGGEVLSTTVSDPFDVPAKRNAIDCPSFEDTLYIQTNWEPSEIGEYDIRVTIDSEADLDNTEDDQVIKDIVYTNCLMGHDDETLLDVELRPRDNDDSPGNFDNVGYGCFYTAENEGSDAIGALVRFGPNTDTEFDIEVRLYTILPGETLNDAAYTSTFYEIQTDDVPANANETFNVFIEFDDTVEMEPFIGDPDFGPAYFVGIANDEISPNELTVMAQDLSDTDNSTARINQTGAGDFVWFTAQQQTPFVRLVVDEDNCFATGPNNIEEFAALEVELEQNMPNPANGMTTIRFTLEEPLDVDFQIVDNTGRIVYTRGMGTLGLGQHQIDLDATRFAPGIYQYSLISGDKKATKSMVITK